MVSATLINRAIRRQMSPLGCNTRSLQSIASRKLFLSGSRFKTTANNRLLNSQPPPKLQQDKKFVYPEKLCIYKLPVNDFSILAMIYVWTGSAGWLSWMLTSDFLILEGFALSTSVLVAQYIVYSSVREIHLPLPSYARVSPKHLRSYIDNVPLSTALEVSRTLSVNNKAYRIAISNLPNVPNSSQIFFAIRAERQKRQKNVPITLFVMTKDYEGCGWVWDVLLRRIQKGSTRR
ncbi:hypothetical protein F4806DRAFT_67232 [Annulohypoxylon nitens]|nr:hypothetical protein F4806DRAFT_67232 [Annulohypoxylon nitens]